MFDVGVALLLVLLLAAAVRFAFSIEETSHVASADVHRRADALSSSIERSVAALSEARPPSESRRD